MHLFVLLVALLGLWSCTNACNIKARGVSDAEKKAIVKKHNELRAKIANGKQSGFPTASDMLEMEWDDHLAKQAQAWAEKCEFEHDDPVDKSGKAAGQNIGWEGKTEETADWDGIIQSFYDEVKDFKPSDIKAYKSNDDTGHFTQLVWAKSNKVGCGYVKYIGDGNEFLYGCNYAPGGNVKTKPIYEAGKPCSKCGGCGSIPGLCKGK